MQHGTKFQIPCFQVYRFSRGYSSNSSFRVSEFPGPLRGSAEGPQKPDSMFPSVQIPGYSSANSRFRVSEFPRFQGPSVGPRRDPNFQIPCFLVGRFQDTPPQIPDSKIPSVQIPGYSWANSRFRVSEFPRPPLGSKPKWEHVLRSTTPKFQIPSFRVSEVPSSVQGRGTPKSPQIPDSEFPSFRGPLLALGSQQEGLANSQIPSFRV